MSATKKKPIPKKVTIKVHFLVLALVSMTCFGYVFIPNTMPKNIAAVLR